MKTVEPIIETKAAGWWRRPHRRLYDWVLHWAETPHGAFALFLLAFAESSFFPVPPDVLLIALVLGARQRWWRLASFCTIGSVLGGIAGYGIGAGLMETVGHPIIRFYRAESYYERVNTLYAQYDYWVVFTAAFTPIPYKVFTIASGAFGMNLFGFVGLSFVGRGARFFLVAGLLRLFGRPLRNFIERYFDLLSLVFVVLLVGGFAVLKWAT
jgi:membrane protein YqaA with SNARE-associated domain